MITNTVERQRAQYIYDTYFDPHSKHLLDFNLFDTLMHYGAIDVDKYSQLSEDFEKIGDALWEQMKQYDKKQLAGNDI